MNFKGISMIHQYCYKDGIPYELLGTGMIQFFVPRGGKIYMN